MVHIQVLGLWCKFVTEPWMAIIYASESLRCHFDMVLHIKYAVNFVQRVKEEPEFFFTVSNDAFGRPLIKDDLLLALLIVDDSNLVELTTIISIVASATLELITRQMQKYLNGALSNPSELMKLKASIFGLKEP